MSVMSKGTRFGLAALLPTLLYTSSVYAAGFYIQESSVSALGSAFSGSVSSINDASTVYFNPAGMTDLGSRQVSAGVNLLLPTSQISDTGSTFDFNGPGAGGVGPVGGSASSNPYDPSAVPNLYFASPVGFDNKLWAGLGVNAPFGLGSEYDDGYFARFDSTKTKLTVINVSPVVAYKVNDAFSLGGGVDIQYANAELKSAISNIATTGTSTLKGKDYSVGFNLGFTYRPTDTTKIGAHYRSAMEQKLEGSITVKGLSSGNFSVPGSAALSLPDITTLGVTQDVQDDWRVMGQLTYFGWDNFDAITAFNTTGGVVSSVTQDYHNTLAFSVGSEYDLNDMLTLRAGYQYDPTPTSDNFRTTRTPDGDRNWFTAGGTYKWSDSTSFDFAGAYIFVDEGNINVSRNATAVPAVVNADTDGHVGIVSAAINYKF